jgi:hypothetical protein
MLNGLKRAIVLKIFNDVLKDEVKHMGKDRKTTFLGILTIIGTAVGGGISLLHGEPVDWKLLFAGFAAGWGLVHAADSKG